LTVQKTIEGDGPAAKEELQIHIVPYYLRFASLVSLLHSESSLSKLNIASSILNFGSQLSLNQICSKASKLLKNQDMTTPKWVYYRSMN
jgi:hypothetical protein